MKERSSQPGHATIAFLSRLLVSAAIVVSLLSALVPFSAASSAHLCTMECCVGKAPHLAGECSTDLMKGLPQPTYEQEVLCGLHLDEVTHLTAARPALTPIIKADAGQRETGHPGSCGDAAASEQSAPAEPTDSNPSPTSGTSLTSRAASISPLSLTSPCSAECGACSGGSVRQPRPRDPATIAGGASARQPSRAHLFRSPANQSGTLRGHYQQPQPRGPPTSLS